jgi:pantoate--beta-alanine ligase
VNTPRNPFLTTTDIKRVREFVRSAKLSQQSVGFIPTMGALHEGHVSLMRQAKQECDVVVASIFVNPTQFAPDEDLKKYPRPLDDDLIACREAGVTCVFHPDVPAMYPEDSVTVVEVRKLTCAFEGADRPTHFRGVTTVVMKLLHIVMPDRVFLGQKDYQQQLVIRRMCIDLDVPVEIVTCPTVREPDGLAMSSRNRYLNAGQRNTALSLSAALRTVEQAIGNGESDISRLRAEMQDTLRSTPGVDLDYATIVHPETLEEIESVQPSQVVLIAVRVGPTRLIDNIVIHSPSP